MIEIIRIPAFKDNYIWLLVNRETQQGAVVDPGDASPVVEILSAQSIQLSEILITHHHLDHCGGVAELLEHCAGAKPIPVFAPKHERNPIPHSSYPLVEGNTISLSIGIQFQILDIPGHTLGHIAYVGDGKLFCGDTLFTGGCGRLFEGTAEQMLHSLQKLKALPNETLVYCGHEYTLNNLLFANTLESGNTDLQKRLQAVKQLRDKNEATVPSLLIEELQTNPFLRCDTPSIIQAAHRLYKSPFPELSLDSEVNIFLAIRRLKDSFTT